MRLRQVVLVTAGLDRVVEEVGGALGLSVCYRDPGVAAFGLHNALMPVGDQFLEVVSPVRQGTTAGRYLDRRGGDGGYMAIFQVPDLAAARRRVDELGIRIVWEGSRPGISGIHLHPADIGGAIVSLDQADPPDDWPWAGPEWRDHVRTEVVSCIARMDVQAAEPAVLAHRWGQVLGVDPVQGPDGTVALGLDQGVVRFSSLQDDRGDGITSLDLTATDRTRAGEDLSAGGVTFRLV